DWAFGSYPYSFAGLVSRENDRCAIFIDRQYVNHRTISHELFHATHRILDNLPHEFSPNGHEPFAYLNGYLAELVYGDLRRWRIPVALRDPQVSEKFIRK